MIVDLSALPIELRRQVDDICRRDYDLQVMKALDRQKRVAAYFHRNRPRAINDLGEQTMAIDPVFDAMWARARGADWKDDQDFMKWFMNHPENQDCRVRSTGSKTMIGWRPPERSRHQSRGQVETVTRGAVRSTTRH